MKYLITKALWFPLTDTVIPVGSKVVDKLDGYQIPGVSSRLVGSTDEHVLLETVTILTE